MHTRTLLAALALAAPVTVLGAAAHATVSPEDEATPVIDVTVADKAGDARVTKSARDLPKRVTHSVEMTQVSYDVDRTTETLTISYPLRRVVASDRYRQLVATVIVRSKRSDDPDEPFVGLLSNAAKSTVRVFTYDGGDNYAQRVCKAAGTTADPGTDVVTQTVPFSCLRGALDHGFLRSLAGVGTTHSQRDIAQDTAPFSRDLPLTAYAAPADPGAQG